MKNEMKRAVIECSGVLILTCLILLANLALQPRISEAGGRGWDGFAYHAIAERIIQGGGLEGAAAAPFVYRVGEPWLVARLFPEDLIDGFQYINFFFAIGCVFFLWLLAARLVVSSWLRVGIVLLFVLHWQNPVRFVAHYPVYVDPALLFFGLMATFLLLELDREPDRRFLKVAFCLLAFIGSLFREAMLVWAVAALFSRVQLGGGVFIAIRNLVMTNSWRWFPVVLSLSAIVLTHRWAPSGGYSFYETAQQWMYKKSLGQMIYSLFMAWGMLVPFVIYFRTELVEWFTRHVHMAVVMAGCFVIAYVGGSDTNRFFAWMMPYVLLSCAVITERVSVSHFMGKVALVVVFLLHAITARYFWLIPDPNVDRAAALPNLFLTPLSSHFDYMILVPEYGPWQVQAKLLLQNVIATAVAYLLLEVSFGKGKRQLSSTK